MAETALRKQEKLRETAEKRAGGFDAREEALKGKVEALKSRNAALEKLGRGEAAKQISTLQGSVEKSKKEASSLRTELKEARAQVRRSALASVGNAEVAQRSAKELRDTKRDVAERLAADGEGWRFANAADERRRGEIEREILVEELTRQLDLPEAYLYDKSSQQYTGRARLVCGGLVKRGIAAKRVQDVLLYVAKHLFRVQLPFYHEKHRVSKQLELRWRLPSETLCKRFAGNLSPAPP